MAAKPGAAMAVIAACSLALLVSADEVKESRSPPPSFASGKHLNGYTHTWPEMEFGWRIVAGTLMGFCGAAFGSAGGVGGGGIYVPMLALLIGFDSKSSAAISKCMIVGAAGSMVFYNIRQRHPMLDMSIIDYDLALLFQPMLVLGISIGVTFNVLFADWMITLIIIILFFTTSIKAFFKGVQTWKKETIQKEAEVILRSAGTVELENNSLPGAPKKCPTVSLIRNVHWTKLGIICCVWIAILTLQIIKSYMTTNCSLMYWIVNLLQIPVAVAASGYEAVRLYIGKTVIASRGEKGTNFKARKLVFFCFIGVLAGTIGGLVGIGGGIILGPLFLEMGVPPQVSTATTTFAMLFSSSMSVVEYYLLKRFPIPYTLYFVGVTTIAAIAGQYIVKRVIAVLGRTSIIIFILAFTIFISTFLIGSEGLIHMVHKIEHHNYMGFESMCATH